MKKPGERIRIGLLILPFLSLFLWFRFEHFIHWNLYLHLACVLFFFGISYVLSRTLSGKGKAPILILWIAVSILGTVDLIQQATYRTHSKEKFIEQAEKSTGEVERRALSMVRSTRDYSFQLERELREVPSLNPDTLFLKLSERKTTDDFWWGVYGRDGSLLAWNGSVESRESTLADDAEDVSVVHLLHRQFLKVIRSVRISESVLMISVLQPISADYGIQNRYLQGFNRLTDGLSIRPALLYSSEKSTTVSPDLVLRTIAITPEFFIAVVYELQQYNQFLQSRIFQLHWWFEMVSLLFLVLTTIVVFFEYLGLSGQDVSPQQLLRSWLSIVVLSLLAAFTLGQFSAFGLNGLFQILDVKPSEWGRLFRSPGNLLFTSFFALIVLSGFLLWIRKAKTGLTWKRPIVSYGTAFITFVLCAFFLFAYYGFVQRSLISKSFEMIDVYLFQLDPVKLALALGVVWLDLSFALVLLLILTLIINRMPRDARSFLLLIVLQAMAFGLFYWSCPGRSDLPLIPTVLLYFGSSLIIFSLPQLRIFFVKINLLSRFLVVLLSLSLLSALFHFTRVHYADELQTTFIETEAAEYVRGHDRWINDVLIVSEEQLDEVIGNISLDTRISDLAYRLWTRTDLAQFGYRSALEIYGNDGRLLNRFSVNLPKLAVPMFELPTGDNWENEQRDLPFGNARKPIQYGIRRLPEAGYLLVEVLQDYQNLPFVASASPFQELFRPEKDPRLYASSLYLNVYDLSWHPVFVSSPDLSAPPREARDLLQTASDAWADQTVGGTTYRTYNFRLKRGYGTLLIESVPFRSHLVHLIDLALLNLLWLSLFVLILILFFRPYLGLHFQSETQIRFNFFQKLMIAFIVFSMIPLASFSILIRRYVLDNAFKEMTGQALRSFSVASRVVDDYLFTRSDSAGRTVFSDELVEGISQWIQQDVSLFYDRHLVATSTRDIYDSGLVGRILPGETYLDLFLNGRKYSITEQRIGQMRYLNISGRVFTGRHSEEVISIPFLLDERQMESEIVAFRDYMVLVGGGLVLLAVMVGYLLAGRFANPVRTLIQGTREMSGGNLQFRISKVYQDEFQQLVESFNAMAGSLHRQQEVLEERRAYIENILNHITTAVISINSTINVTTVNPAAVEMLGIDPRNRGPLREIQSPSEEWPLVLEAVESFLKRRTDYQMKEVSLQRTNVESNLRLVYVPLIEDSEWNGAVLLVEDISDIIRSNRLSAWAEMARRVAHEVKNPLTPIQLAVEHLVKVYDDGSEDFEKVLRSCRDSILKQVKTLRRLVSDFSQYGRPPVLNRTNVDLTSFLTDLAGTYDQHLPGAIRIQTEFEPGLPVVHMDAEKMRHALMNIIENGLQAMNGEGSITLTAGKSDNAGVCIRIRDSGGGVAPEALPRLFEPYFSTKSGGTGLGLPIAKKTIEDHGGRIVVDSAPGRGTTVSIRLPIR